jgi:(2Fe-2S) ferredoxin
MSHTHTLPFSLVGRLEGYTFGKGGKIRRLLIETSQDIHSIKLTHLCRIELLRSILNKEIQQGSWLTVLGRQKVDKKGVVKHLKAKEIVPALVKTTLLPPIMAKPILVPAPQGSKTKILVCQKSDCCKRGSAQLQAAIETVIDDRNLTHQVSVKAVGCLKHCSKGPVIAIDKTRYKEADVRAVERFLDERFAPAPESIPAA